MRQTWLRLSLLGAIGSASMLLAPIERLAPDTLDPALVRLAATVQPLILGILAALLGAWLAPKVALDAPAVRAWAERRPPWPVLKAQLAAALPAALLVGLLLAAFASVLAGSDLPGQFTGFPMPLATKMLYGGIVEELLLRWGVMTVLVWAAWRLAGSPESVPHWCYWAGAALAALLFAVGHLPILFVLLADPPTWLITLVIAGNFLPGLLFGWLYWRRGLEAAMLAHGLAHLFGTLAQRMF